MLQREGHGARDAIQRAMGGRGAVERTMGAGMLHRESHEGQGSCTEKAMGPGRLNKETKL